MAHPIGKFETNGSYFEALQSYDVAGMTLTEYLYPAGHQEPTHFHAPPRFHYYLEGGQSEFFGSQRLDHPTYSLAFSRQEGG